MEVFTKSDLEELKKTVDKTIMEQDNKFDLELIELIDGAYGLDGDYLSMDIVAKIRIGFKMED